MAKPTDISEAKIRQAIWMIKAKKTKKAVCEHLGIAYNTKRLDAIIQEFHNNIDREKIKLIKTPQGFIKNKIKILHNKNDKKILTDDSQLFRNEKMLFLTQIIVI